MIVIGRDSFELEKRRQLFLRAHNKTLSVAAVRINNPDRSPVEVHGCNAAPTPTGFAEIVSGVSTFKKVRLYWVDSLPVARDPHPASRSGRPVTRHPHSGLPRRQDPAPRYPMIASPGLGPTPVTRCPDISGSWRDRLCFDANRRRSLSYYDLSCAGPRRGHFSRRGGRRHRRWFRNATDQS